MQTKVVESASNLRCQIRCWDLNYILGELVGERTWPHDVSLAFPAWIGQDRALGLATDTLGVQQVVRIQFGSR